MPYNTRRKSLSLPSLGIHVPSSHPRSSARPSPNNNINNMPSPRSASETSAERLNKKVKRHHPPTKLDHTPPPSPGLHRSIELDESEPAEAKTIDLEGINDEIVEAVIVRLQKTSNRPHLVKELSAVLMDRVKIVQLSANPCAIISSRLAGYMKRPCWSAIAPCPLAKELETVHPRRTYFYLTTCRRQPLPDPATAQLQQCELITPPLSSSASTSEEADGDRRRELSLSPEIDLSSPEFDEVEEDVPMPGTPMGSASGRHPSLQSMSRVQRGGEPPLEKDEKEFTQTADGLQKRKLSGGLLSATPADQVALDDGMQNEQLFGEHNRNFVPTFFPYMAFMTSPAMRPSVVAPPKKDNEAESWSKLDAMLEWDRSPETVELDELDGLLNDF
ncbi:hypothetical protein DL766_002213 [Monosporascus sp. MC13-8B]|uniref:GDS1 winged helix domain-containing protein n=1 Tax=Monosporascus cannonballus TaxID=155416 RepID=A0ABY0GUW3_9PEZI|nr:hypothetical protein DL762_010504 [Monosporascus cannonballus]RYO80587.1 hypothetical protein DL763_008853 [Monosporascus cannonballus]RYP36031.1 hypothetical protein DL766_002213 [Monosporascus sp. MC13-8B]